MEGDSHDSIRGVERLLYPVAMVNVYVNIEHSLVVPGKGGNVIAHDVGTWNNSAIKLNKIYSVSAARMSLCNTIMDT